MKANSGKCHFLSSLDMNTKISFSSFDIENAHSPKLLGVTIDRMLNFHDYVANICKKASAKISTMTRVFPYMLLNQRKLIMTVIVMFQFCYCPLTCMNHNKPNRINS